MIRSYLDTTPVRTVDTTLVLGEIRKEEFFSGWTFLDGFAKGEGENTATLKVFL